MPKNITTTANTTSVTANAAAEFAAKLGGEVVTNADGSVTVVIPAPAAAVALDDVTVVAPVVEGAGLTEKELCLIGRIKNLDRRRSSGDWRSEKGKGTILSGRGHKIATVDMTFARSKANKAYIANAPEYIGELLAMIDKLTGGAVS